MSSMFDEAWQKILAKRQVRRAKKLRKAMEDAAAKLNATIDNKFVSVTIPEPPEGTHAVLYGKGEAGIAIGPAAHETPDQAVKSMQKIVRDAQEKLEKKIMFGEDKPDESAVRQYGYPLRALSGKPGYVPIKTGVNMAEVKAEYERNVRALNTPEALKLAEIDGQVFVQDGKLLDPSLVLEFGTPLLLSAKESCSIDVFKRSNFGWALVTSTYMKDEATTQGVLALIVKAKEARKIGRDLVPIPVRVLERYVELQRPGWRKEEYGPKGASPLSCTACGAGTLTVYRVHGKCDRSAKCCGLCERCYRNNAASFSDCVACQGKGLNSLGGDCRICSAQRSMGYRPCTACGASTSGHYAWCAPCEDRIAQSKPKWLAKVVKRHCLKCQGPFSTTEKGALRCATCEPARSESNPLGRGCLWCYNGTRDGKPCGACSPEGGMHPGLEGAAASLIAREKDLEKRAEAVRFAEQHHRARGSDLNVREERVKRVEGRLVNDRMDFEADKRTFHAEDQRKQSAWQRDTDAWKEAERNYQKIVAESANCESCSKRRAEARRIEILRRRVKGMKSTKVENERQANLDALINYDSCCKCGKFTELESDEHDGGTSYACPDGWRYFDGEGKHEENALYCPDCETPDEQERKADLEREEEFRLRVKEIALAAEEHYATRWQRRGGYALMVLLAVATFAAGAYMGKVAFRNLHPSKNPLFLGKKVGLQALPNGPKDSILISSNYSSGGLTFGTRGTAVTGAAHATDTSLAFGGNAHAAGSDSLVIGMSDPIAIGHSATSDYGSSWTCMDWQAPLGSVWIAYQGAKWEKFSPPLSRRRISPEPPIVETKWKDAEGREWFRFGHGWARVPFFPPEHVSPTPPNADGSITIRAGR